MLKNSLIASVICLCLININGCKSEAQKAEEAEIKAKEELVIESKKVAKQVIDEFFALDSKLSVGVTFVQYGEDLAALKASLDKLYRLDSNSSAFPVLEASLSYYVDAMYIWGKCISSCNSYSKDLLYEYVDPDRDNSYLNNDEFTREVQRIVSVHKLPNRIIDYEKRRAINQTESVNLIWREAKAKIVEAENSIK